MLVTAREGIVQDNFLFRTQPAEIVVGDKSADTHTPQNPQEPKPPEPPKAPQQNQNPTIPANQTQLSYL